MAAVANVDPLRQFYNSCAYLMLSRGESPRAMATERMPALHRALLRDLQRVHDGYAPQAWPEQIAKVARAYNVEPSR